MKAMIFAAGLGTRLKPLTDSRPKALVELAGKPLLYHQLDLLIHSGFHEIVVNIHHFPELMLESLSRYHHPLAHIIISDESTLLLDTGGGLKKAAPELRSPEPILLINVDVICNFDLPSMLAFHQASQASVTLAVTQRKSARNLLFNKNMRMIGWENRSTGEQIKFSEEAYESLAFSGIHIIQDSIFNFFDDKEVFSIIEFYLRIGNQVPIMAYSHDETGWFDLGDIQKLAKAELYLGGQKS